MATTALIGGHEDFNTPRESPDDLRIDLAPEIQAELDELETTEDFITKNQESIARSAGGWRYVCILNGNQIPIIYRLSNQGISISKPLRCRR